MIDDFTLAELETDVRNGFVLDPEDVVSIIRAARTLRAEHDALAQSVIMSGWSMHGCRRCGRWGDLPHSRDCEVGRAERAIGPVEADQVIRSNEEARALLSETDHA